MIVTCNDCAGTGGAMVEGEWRDCSNCEGTGEYEKRVKPQRRQPRPRGVARTSQWVSVRKRKHIDFTRIKANVARMLYDREQGAWPDNTKATGL